MMNGLLYGIVLQWKIDFRRKDILIMYYIMPLVFFLLMGGVFSSVSPDMRHTLIYSMTIFAICAGGLMGAPTSIISFYNSDIKKAYKVGGVPLWSQAFNSFLSAVVHMSIISVIITILSPLLFNADRVKNVPYFFGVLFLFMLCTIAIGMLLGLFVKSQSKLTMFSILLFLPSIILSDIMLPPNLLPDFLQAISNVIPAKWAMNAMMGEDLLLNLSLLSGVFVLAVIIMALRLRVIAKE